MLWWNEPAKYWELIHMPSKKKTPQHLWLHLEMLFINDMNRLCDEGKPWWSPTLTRNKLDLLLIMQTKLTGTWQPVSKILGHHTTRVPPTGLPKEHSWKSSPSPQNTCVPAGKTSMHPPKPWWGCRVGHFFPRPGWKPNCYPWIRVLTEESFNHLNNLNTRNWRVTAKVPRVCCHNGRHAGSIPHRTLTTDP